MTSVALALAVSATAAGAAHANLLTNGSFEDPVLGPGNSCGGSFTYCRGYNPSGGPIAASDIPGWFTIGTGGSIDANGTNDAVLLLGSLYTETNGSTGAPLHFTAGHGNQSVDLTGAGNQGVNGVKQTVATEIGHIYALSFMLGNQYDEAPGYTLDSLLRLSVTLQDSTNTVVTQNYANGESTNVNDLTWLTFTFMFTALDLFTTIAFENLTPVGDNMAGLDNVVLLQVPEPATALVLAAGLAALGWRRRAAKLEVQNDTRFAPRMLHTA